MELTSGLLLAIMVLAAISSIQFYKGRKLNLQLMEFYLRSIEEVVKPEDKDYVWLGGYIGFRANYKINRDNIRKFEYTLTLLPRHSILYFPISLVTSRHDKLYIVVRPFAQIKREAHLIQKGYYRLKPGIENEPLLQKEEVEIAGKKYEALFEKRRDMENLKALLENLPNPKDIKHIALTPKTNVFYVQMKPDPDTIKETVEKIVRFANEKLKESPFSS
ncbi:hypothetical protein [Thermococcus stetteri]|uniref:hypothetical protein n=1 Tax=Thermococcus stetteri TaxID=49900 RepID=UPI001AE51DC2|nr:hypothetical protein [Thermococcus stetteri]MBP1912906.1 hypothetical protein [Thermococcus stetteri]